MTSVPAEGSGQSKSGSSSVPSNFSGWDEFIPKSVSDEDSVTDAENNKIWAAFYKNVGMGSASEKEKRAARAGVYVYSVKNGTSREGNYSGEIKLSNGVTISAAAIPRAASVTKIRKWMRANMSEAYQFLKQTGVMESDERFVAQCSKFGISPGDAFATADFLTDCPDFTPSEAKAHNTMFAHSIERARRAREGKSLEAVEHDRVTAELAASGPKTDQTPANTTSSW